MISSKINLRHDYNVDESSVPQTPIKAQSFSKEDYSPIMDEKVNALGNISITDIDFNEEGFFNHSINHPTVDADLLSGALNLTYNRTSFVNTTNVAQSDNLDKSITYSDIITILLNETILVKYNTSIDNRYLVYRTRLTPCFLTKLFVQNESSTIVEEINDEFYSIDNSDYLVFDYKNFFKSNSHNFTMYLMWQYNLTVNNWELFHYQEDDIILTEQEQSINGTFSYKFNLLGLRYHTIEQILPTLNLDVDLKLNPPNKDLLFSHSLSVDDVVQSNFLDANNTINTTIQASNRTFNLNFTANYVIRFEDPVENTWAIDRLVELKNIRERIYLPTLISGPDRIYLDNLTIYERTIKVDQVISNSSLFGRDVLYYDANVSVIKEYLKKSLIFTENFIRKKGLKIILPFLFKGETNPFIIRYTANNKLLVIVTDIISMPIMGLNIELYYHGKLYGTYISNEQIQPMAPASTDENGEITFLNLPDGNYTIKIYKENRFIMQTLVNTFKEINHISTEIFHFPLWVIIFGSVNGLILLIGLIIYLNYKKRS